jgi:drug/metabolite transporter (DMT)-like permease
MILLAHFALKETLTRMHWTSMLTILAGMITISLHGFTNGIDFRSGDTLIILSVLFYSLGHILYRKYLHDVEAYLPLFMRSVSAVVLFLMISPFMNMSLVEQVTSMPASFIAPLLGFAFISRFLNSVTFYQAVNRLSMTIVSLVSSLSLVGSTVFASYYLGEALHWYHFAGILLIIGGSVIADAHLKRPAEHTEHRLAQKLHS